MRRTPFGSSGQSDWTALFTGAGLASALGGDFSPREADRLQEVSGFGANPGGLRMLRYVPTGLPAGSPLVVVLHGCGQSAAAYDRGAGWSTLADRLRFAVLAPEQTSGNNMQGCFSWFQPDDTRRGSGEVESIREMIVRAIGDHRLDSRRVFVTGLSAGGAMASAMLAAYPELFAGGALIAGLPYGAAGNVQQALGSMRKAPSRSRQAWGDLVREASPHRGPWPRISVWHGDADTTVSPGNAEAILAQWGDVHGLREQPSAQDTVDGYPRRVWHDGQGRPVVESYTISGLAHGTPIMSGEGEDECGAAQAYVLEAGISSSYRIAEFWGLARRRPAQASARRRTTQADADHASAAAPRWPDPKDVVTAALKAAGVLKRS